MLACYVHYAGIIFENIVGKAYKIIKFFLFLNFFEKNYKKFGKYSNFFEKSIIIRVGGRVL